MTTITYRAAHAAARPARPEGAAAGIIARIAGLWTRHALYRRTLAELDALSDRELADIGISRYDIPAIARDTARGA